MQPRRRALAAGVAALAMLAAAAGFQPAEPTLAGWTQTSNVSAPFTAAKVYPVSLVKCAQSEGLLGGDITVTWSPPASRTDGLTPTRYRVVWDSVAGTDRSEVDP